MKRRTVYLIGLSLLLLLAGAGAILIFRQKQVSPLEGTAEEMAQPRPLRKVVVEVDRMSGTPDLPLSLTINGSTLALRDIFVPAGLDLAFHDNVIPISAQDSLSLGDLHSIIVHEPSLSSDGDLKLRLLMLTKSSDHPDYEGWMFTEDRTSLALFTSTLQEDLPASLRQSILPAELFRVAAHELTHCFNVHHADYDGDDFFANSTIESYSRSTTVQWTLSKRSLDHFLGHPMREVLPGSQGVTFGTITTAHDHGHQTNAESFIVDDSLSSGLVAVTSTAQQEAEIGSTALVLQLTPTKPYFVLGEPVYVKVLLTNEGRDAVGLKSPLEPEYQRLAVKINFAGVARPFVPAFISEFFHSEPLALAPGATISKEVPIFFDRSGWTFQEPGTYDVSARFLPSGPAKDVVLEANTRLQVLAPSPREASAAETMLGHDEGLFLLFGGGDHLVKGADGLRRILREYPSSVYAAAARPALGLAALHPTIDPYTGVRPRPRLAEAAVLLKNILAADLPISLRLRAHAELGAAYERSGDWAASFALRLEALRALENRPELRKLIAQSPDWERAIGRLKREM